MPAQELIHWLQLLRNIPSELTTARYQIHYRCLRQPEPTLHDAPDLMLRQFCACTLCNYNIDSIGERSINRPSLRGRWTMDNSLWSQQAVNFISERSECARSLSRDSCPGIPGCHWTTGDLSWQPARSNSHPRFHQLEQCVNASLMPATLP